MAGPKNKQTKKRQEETLPIKRRSRRNATKINYNEDIEEVGEPIVTDRNNKKARKSSTKKQTKVKATTKKKKKASTFDDSEFQVIEVPESDDDFEEHIVDLVSEEDEPKKASRTGKGKAKPKGKGKKKTAAQKTPKNSESNDEPSKAKKGHSKKKKNAMAQLLEAPGDAGAEGDSSEKEEGPMYTAELARSGRAMCHKCQSLIAKGVLRVGVITEGGSWGPMTRWQHLPCTIFRGIESCEDIAGYDELGEEEKDSIAERVKASAFEVDQDYEPVNPDEMVREEWREKREPPPEVILPLLPYQQEGLGWMYHQEQTDFHGGILADEMGMGKTLQAISLIVTNRPSMDEVDEVWSKVEVAHERTPDKSLRGGTLVICPMIALLQWQTEIAKFTAEGTLKVKIHHGSKRTTLSQELLDADVVITTFSIVEAEYRKMTSPEKIPCPECGKRLYPDKLVIHRKYFCGESAERTAAQSLTQRKRRPRGSKNKTFPKKGSKSSTMTKKGKKRFAEEEDDDESWDESTEDNQTTPKLGQKRKQFGGKKKMFADEIKKQKKMSPITPSRKRLNSANPKKYVDEDSDDEGCSATATDFKSVLHQISWFRIILDEAHAIKSRSSSTAKAVFNLTSLNKWCLTGTPLQNRVGELYSLIRFLRLDPWGYYFCRRKGCNCKSLHYRFGPEWRSCEECGHSPMQHYSVFNKQIMNPIKRSGYVGEGRRGMLTLKDQILDEVLLRRTKINRAEDIVLPPRIVRVKQHRLDEREEDFYQALYTQSQAQFNTYIDSGTVLHNYAHIFDILIRLRQAVDHPYLVIYSKTRNDGDASANSRALAAAEEAVGSGGDKQSAGGEEEEESCGICHDPPERPVTSSCKHSFCFSCIENMMQSAMESADALCPVCEEPLTISLTECTQEEKEEGNKLQQKQPAKTPKGPKIHRKSILNKINLSSFQTSTKMEALMQELHAMERRDPVAKAIVFSQFVNMLDLLQYRIKLGGFNVVILSGHMSIDQRDKTLKSFREDPDCKVLLISLKAGGVALNLTVANHIFLMDPWWNPAGEMQAIDRTHRIGQYKPIFGTRFIIEDTIEERILRLQDKKKLVFDGTVGGDQASLARLTVDDLRFLFSS
mmetsp:Transcript_9469/g.11786  ORF Transcript_9469/g.11786 Transcript_9469/m.11786 type:complete len:1115 (+) Transcript_9469:115-3459(+)